MSIGSIGDASTVAGTSVAVDSEEGGYTGGDYGGDDDGGDDGYGYGDDGNDHDDVVNGSDEVDPRMASMVSTNTNTPVKGGMVGGVKGRTSAPLYGSGRASAGSARSSPSSRRTSLDSNAEVLVDLDKTPKGFKSMKGGFKGTLLTDGTFVADEDEDTGGGCLIWFKFVTVEVIQCVLCIKWFYSFVPLTKSVNCVVVVLTYLSSSDREEDGSMAANTTGISTDSEGRDAANETTFVADNSFLFQISERNPKYIGNKKR